MGPQGSGRNHRAVLEALELDRLPLSCKTFAMKQSVVTLDMEGVLTPEIWIAVAQKPASASCGLTTWDVPDYDVLMKGRLNLLDQHGLELPYIEKVIASLEPLEGGREFVGNCGRSRRSSSFPIRSRNSPSP